MRIGAILGMMAVTATALAAVPAKADKLDDLGSYGKDFKKAIALADRHDTQAAARERALAGAARREIERAQRESERAEWRGNAPLYVCGALFAMAALQLVLAILFAVVSPIVALAGGRGPRGAPARKVRWSFADVIVTYLVAFLPPLLVIPTLAVAPDFVHRGIFDEWSFSILMGFALLGTAALAFLRIRRRLERKARGGEEAVAPVAPPQRRWAVAAMSGWLLLTVVIVNGIVLLATGLVIVSAVAAMIANGIVLFATGLIFAFPLSCAR